MASITDHDYTDNMAAAKKPLLTDLRESLDSIESYINSTIVDALLDIAADAWPSGYAFTADGTSNFTSSDLYDKLTSKSSYTGGNMAISTTGAWTDVDATNAAITLTPDYLAGDFKVSFQFSVQSVSTNATNEADLRFRLTDSTENSDATPKIHLVTGANATTTTIPVNLMHEFDSWSVASKTVKLQYYIQTLTAMTVNVLANTNTPIAKQAEKI